MGQLNNWGARGHVWKYFYQASFLNEDKHLHLMMMLLRGMQVFTKQTEAWQQAKINLILP